MSKYGIMINKILVTVIGLLLLMTTQLLVIKYVFNGDIGGVMSVMSLYSIVYGMYILFMVKLFLKK